MKYPNGKKRPPSQIHPTSSREQHFLNVWHAVGQFGPEGEPVTQFKFDAERKWRFDFAWPERKVAVEIHGGEFIGGGHNRGRGLMNDCEKMRAAQLQGWIVLPFVGTDLDERPVQVIDQVTEALMIGAMNPPSERNSA